MSLPHALLLVEDNSDDEILTLRGIKASGVPCVIQVIRRGGEALDVLRAPHSPQPDLIVLDFHLPGCNGLEILRELRRHEKTRRVPIVMLSATEVETDVSDCIDAGASSFVPKPMDPRQYVEHVARLVRYWLTIDRGPEATAIA